MTRIGTFSQQQLLMFHTLRTQDRLFEGSVQLASGQKSQQYSGISKNVSRLLAVETAQMRSQEYLNNVEIAQRRIELTDFNLDRVEDIARDLRSFLEDAADAPATTAEDPVDTAARWTFDAAAEPRGEAGADTAAVGSDPSEEFQTTADVEFAPEDLEPSPELDQTPRSFGIADTSGELQVPEDEEGSPPSFTFDEHP